MFEINTSSGELSLLTHCVCVCGGCVCAEGVSPPPHNPVSMCVETLLLHSSVQQCTLPSQLRLKLNQKCPRHCSPPQTEPKIFRDTYRNKAFSAPKICTVLAGYLARFTRLPAWEISLAPTYMEQGEGMGRERSV